MVFASYDMRYVQVAVVYNGGKIICEPVVFGLKDKIAD